MTTIRRWRRFGHDRLYVELPDGTKVGFRDLVTGVDHAESDHFADALRAAADSYLASNTDRAPKSVTDKPPPMPEKAPAPPLSAARPWTDLATNRPGEQARAEAAEEWKRQAAARPIRSRVSRLLNIHTDERAWRMGADGEEAVGDRLERLQRKDPRWRILHAVPVGNRGSDIDHVVIGPGGVFTINAKHHDGAKVWINGDTVMINGHRQPYVRNSRHEATRASQLLTGACGFEIIVTGVIALVGVAEVKTKKAPADVPVVRRGDLARWLSRFGQSLDADQIEGIYAQARRSTTWSTLATGR